LKPNYSNLQKSCPKGKVSATGFLFPTVKAKTPQQLGRKIKNRIEKPQNQKIEQNPFFTEFKNPGQNSQKFQ
jgi:hypothetical protein